MSDDTELEMLRRRRDAAPDFGLFAIAVQIDRLPHTRRADPPTSRAAEAISRPRRASQAMRILGTYLDTPRTDEAAILAAGVTGGWKRCSDLRRLGYLEPTGETLRSSSGAPAMVCRITAAGRARLEAK